MKNIAILFMVLTILGTLSCSSQKEYVIDDKLRLTNRQLSAIISYAVNDFVFNSSIDNLWPMQYDTIDHARHVILVSNFEPFANRSFYVQNILYNFDDAITVSKAAMKNVCYPFHPRFIHFDEQPRGRASRYPLPL